MLRRARVALLSPSRHLQEQLRAVPRLCGESERIGPSREASVGQAHADLQKEAGEVDPMLAQLRRRAMALHVNSRCLYFGDTPL